MVNNNKDIRDVSLFLDYIKRTIFYKINEWLEIYNFKVNLLLYCSFTKFSANIEVINENNSKTTNKPIFKYNDLNEYYEVSKI